MTDDETLGDIVGDLERDLAEAVQATKPHRVKDLIDNLTDADCEVVKQWTDASYDRRLEPRKAQQRQNDEYRKTLSSMTRTEFEKEMSKFR
jgi:hypothetical protein